MKAFDSFYYSFSPTVASVVACSPALSQMVRILLYPLVAVLHASSMVFDILSFSPELSIIISGILASALLGAIYLAPLALVVKLRAIRARRSN